MKQVTMTGENLENSYRIAKYLASSSFLPKAYQGKNLEQRTFDVFAAAQLGSEVGLSPMQSVLNIAVINGQPSIWGDAQLGLVEGSGHLEDIEEFIEGEFPKDTCKAVCIVKRKGREKPTVSEFSIADAKRAGLWDRNTWKSYPKRMLKYRARAFGLRDTFADVLKGLHSVEEMEGSVIDVQTPTSDAVRVDMVEILEQAKVTDVGVPDSEGGTSSSNKESDKSVPTTGQTAIPGTDNTLSDQIKKETE